MGVGVVVGVGVGVVVEALAAVVVVVECSWVGWPRHWGGGSCASLKHNMFSNGSMNCGGKGAGGTWEGNAVAATQAHTGSHGGLGHTTVSQTGSGGGGEMG